MTHKKKKAPNNHGSHKNKNSNNKQANNRSQQNNNNNNSSNKNEDESSTNQDSSQLCEHYDRAINSTCFRRAINQLQSVQCCRKSPAHSRVNKKNSGGGNGSGLTACRNETRLGNELFACTQCGTVVCLSLTPEKGKSEKVKGDFKKDIEENTEKFIEEPTLSKKEGEYLEKGEIDEILNEKEKKEELKADKVIEKEETPQGVSHAHEHFATPRSDCHALYLRLRGDLLYCIVCEKSLSVQGSKIMLLMSLVKKAKGCWSVDVKNSFENDDTYSKQNQSETAGGGKKNKSSNGQSGPQSNNKGPKGGGGGAGKELSLRREVRGFSNLGNTCFFNSVVQNIMHTTWLRQVMVQLAETRSIRLDGEGDTPLQFESLGSMSEALAQLYTSYFNEQSSSSGLPQTLSPKSLFHSLCQFCPMFKSREQQDSQEMFSSLVNALFEEDEKRVKDAIMQRHGIEEDSNKEKETAEGKIKKKGVDGETRAAIKREWKQAQALNPVSAVFGGMLTKYIKCNHCCNINTKSEPFISLSLSLNTTNSDANGSSGHSITSSSGKTRKPNSNSVSKNEKDEDSTSIASSGAASTRRRKALSENKPAPEVDLPPLMPTEKKTTRNDCLQKSPAMSDVAGVKIATRVKNNCSSSEEDDDPDLIMPDDIFGLEDQSTANDTTTSEVFLPETPPNPKTDHSQNPSEIRLKESCSAEEQLVIQIDNLSFNEPDNKVDDSESSGLTSPQDSPEFGERTSGSGNECNSKEVEKSESDLGTGSEKESSRSRGSNASKQATLCSVDSAYASQTSLTGVGGGNACSDAASASNAESVSSCDVERDTAGSSASMQRVIVSREESFGDDINIEKDDEEEDTKVDDATECGSSSENLCLGGLFDEEEDQTLIGGTKNEVVKNHDEKQETEITEDCEALFTAQCLETNLESRRPLPTGGSGECGASSNPLSDPIEALYMSTLSDGVYVPKEPNELSIMSLLKSFTNLEYLTGCNKIKCDKCSVHDNRNLSDACVWYRVTSCPSVLVLHIKRFAQFGLRFRKLNTFVTIQPVLDMAPFCSPDCPTESRSSPKGGTGGGGSRILYRLYGVVEHVGSLHSGHYTAYVCQRGDQSQNNTNQTPATDIVSTLLDRLTPKQMSRMRDGGELKGTAVKEEGEGDEQAEVESDQRESCLNSVWFHVSDTQVRQVPFSKVLSSSPYMLFYEKILT